MQMVRGNGENQFRQYAGQNVRNQNGYNVVQNVRNQVVQNAVQNPGVQNVRNQNGLIVISRIANQNPNGNDIVVATRAEGNATGNNADLDEIEEVNENCILMANLHQASTSGTQTDKAPVYNSDGSAKVHNYDNFYDNEIFNMFTQEEQYTELLKPISEPHEVQQNDSNVISDVSYVEQDGGTVDQHPATIEETCAYFESLYNNLEIKVEKIKNVVTPFPKSNGLPKIDETHALSKPVTSNSVPTPQESNVVKNDNVIAPGMFRINPFKLSREEKFVPNKVRASVRTKPITVSQTHVITKKDVNSDSNGFSSTGEDNTAKTKRPQPRSNTNNDRVSSTSKSSCNKNKEVEVEEHPRNLLLSKNKKHRIQQYLQNEHYALWEVIEFGDSYQAPQEETGNEGSTKKKGRTVAITTEDMQKRRNDAIVSHLEFMDVEIKQDDLNQKFLTSLALEWLMYTIVWRNRANTSSGKGEVHTACVPTASTQVSTASTDVAATNISHDTSASIATRWAILLGSAEHRGVNREVEEKATGKNHALVADEEAPTEFALMAKSSSSSVNKVEARLVEFKTQEIKFYGKIRGLEFKVDSTNNKIEHLMNELEKVKKEKEGLDSKLTGFKSASKDLDTLLGSQKSDKKKEDDTITDYSRNSPIIESNSSDLQNSNSSVFEHGESSESIMSKPMIKFVIAADSPTVIKTNKVETARKPPVKYAEMYRNTSKGPKVRGNQRNWNNLKSQQLGKDFLMKNEACFKCGDFDHLAYDCGVWVEKGKTGQRIRYWDSGCSRHMTGNISYLSEYEPYDGGYVSFGQGGGKITGKDFKLKDDINVLLRTPRQHNMYSIDLNNIVPHKNLTCLVAKASADESKLWHRRLGHLNFKTMNKLVRHNLVKGLPSKCFENDHTCVACLKGKQHKASCKTKLVNSVSKPLYTLHMYLFGPTSVSSLNHKWYCLVVIDDFSRYDNEGEFKNKEMHEFCTRKVIKREFSNARTPQYHVMILNTLDHLGKFDAKGDEGHFVGYSMSSKAFRVFNKRTKKVEENLHVDFLENKLVEKRAGPNLLFDIDTLTNSMNYVPVVVAGTSSTNISAHMKSSNNDAQDACNADAPESSGISNPTATSKSTPAEQMESLTVESAILIVSSPVLTACLDTSPGTTSGLSLISKEFISQGETPSLYNTLTLSNRFEDTIGVEADLSNIESSIPASPTPTLRIHKDHPKSQIIGQWILLFKPDTSPRRWKNTALMQQSIKRQLLIFYSFIYSHASYPRKNLRRSPMPLKTQVG
nr:hypothetical protein [Tanacetum cinerariifolium]